MSLTDKEIFTAQRLPIRLCADQAAALLNFKPYDIPVLVQARLLKPLGSPAPNSPKFFSTAEVQELAADRAWLDKATKAVAGNWRKRNENAHHRFRHDAAKQAANALKNGNPASEASEAEWKHMQDQRNYPKPNLESGANPAQLPGDVKAKLRPARDTGDLGGIGNLSPQKPEGASDGSTSTKAKAPERPGSQRPIPKPRQARQA